MAPATGGGARKRARSPNGVPRQRPPGCMHVGSDAQSAGASFFVPEAPIGEVRLVSGERRLFLDQVGGEHWVLTDTVTQEVRRVPGAGPWVLTPVGEGDGVALGKDMGDGCTEPEVILAEDLLEASVFVDSEGHLFCSGGRFGASLLSLEKVMCMHNMGRVSIRMSDGNAMADIVAAGMRRARSAGARLYWSAFDLDRTLGLRCFRGQPSKWVWNSCSAWQKFFSERFDSGLMIFSKHAGSVSETSESLPFSMRLFEQLALSTLALLLQLGRWGWCSPQRGEAFRDRAPAAAAQQALRALLRHTCATPGNRIVEIVVDDH